MCKADHRELRATAMGMDCNGGLALLAGRRHSALVQLHWDSHNTLGKSRIEIYVRGLTLGKLPSCRSN